MNLILRQARLLDGTTVDIAIRDQSIAAVASALDATADEELDLDGKLVLPAFVNGQLHACKSFWRRLLSTLPEEVQRLPRFEAASHVKQLYTADNVFKRVDEVMRLAIQHGTCAIRLFGDVDEDSGVSAVEGLLRIREKYAPLLTVQVVAFPQDGVTGERTLSLMREALTLGADVVGGIPWIEPDAESQSQHTKMCFDLAAEFERDLHFVCDDVLDAGVRSLEGVARATIARGWHGRVAATQCAALAAYPDDYAAEVIGLLQEAGITIFSNSHVSLIATEFDAAQQPWPRGLTRVRELLAAGVPVACGQDDIDNWFYPFGRNDMLEVAQFMAHSGQFAWPQADGTSEVERVLPMVTSTPARLLGLADYGLHVGAAANLVVLDAASWREAIQLQPDKRYVILRGRVVAETVKTTRLKIED